MNPALALAPAALVGMAFVLLPFGRMVEIPMGVLSLLGAYALWARPSGRDGVPWLGLGLLYLAFTLPMAFSLVDAVASGKSLRSTVGTIRYALSCVALLWVFQTCAGESDSQSRVLRMLGLLSAILLVLWSLDGLMQSVTGRNVLGYGVGEGYVNGVFGDDDNIKLGITVTLLLPIGLVHALRHWSLPAVLLFLGLCLLIIALSGKRAAWIATGVELLALAAYYRWRGSLVSGRLLAVSLAAVLAIGLAYATSDWVQMRSQVVVTALDEPDYDNLYAATGKRLPIWKTAIAMGRDNWVNGVGPRGFRFAYADYAEEGDHWAEPLRDAPGSRGVHAHQLLLDIFAETGIIGIAGYFLVFAILLRLWLSANAAARSRALPFGVSLIAMMFPINTHPAWYSSWSALFLWTFIGLYLYALCEARDRVDPT